MATVLVTLVLPTTRTDGSAFPASDYASADIFRADNGGAAAQVGTIIAPALSFSDTTVPAPDSAVYTATIFDTSTPALESAPSAGVAITIPTPVAPPSAPTLTVKQTA